MNTVIRIIFLSLGTIITFINLYILYATKSNEFNKTGLKVFLLEDLFFMGEFVFEKVKIGANGKRVRKLEEVYDSAMAGQIARSANVAPYSYILFFAPLIFMILAITKSIIAVFAMVLLIVFLMFYFDIWIDNFLKKRHERILIEFSTVISKMSLLVNVGITASEAFSKVAYSGEGILYKEMQRTVVEIENGKSIDLALGDFSFRCGCKEIRKFVSIYKQNLTKGGPEFPILISDMMDTIWEERKTRARLMGAAAEQKLLIPIMLMFTGVLIMVIVPAFNSLI